MQITCVDFNFKQKFISGLVRSPDNLNQQPIHGPVLKTNLKYKLNKYTKKKFLINQLALLLQFLIRQVIEIPEMISTEIICFKIYLFQNTNSIDELDAFCITFKYLKNVIDIYQKSILIRFL